MKLMPSLSMAGLKKNPSVRCVGVHHHFASNSDAMQLIPLLAIVGAGGVWAAYYIGRLALRNPDVR